jgi:hypothetical protein
MACRRSRSRAPVLAGFARWIDAQLFVCVRSLARASTSARIQRACTTAPAGLKRLTSPTKEPEPSSGGHLTDAPASANLPCALGDGRLQRKSSAWSSYPPWRSAARASSQASCVVTRLAVD